MHIEGYYSDYGFVVLSVNGKEEDLPVTLFVSEEEAYDYYSDGDH